jgi:F-type H+-transporting ATPase subunit b
MQIQVSAIIFQIINFVILLLILKKLVYKPILTILENRANRVAEGLKAAEKNLAIQEELERKSDKALAQAKKEAEAIISSARSEADRLLRDAGVQAKAEAKRLIEKEQAAAKAKFQADAKKIERDISHTVLAATEKILGQYLDKKLQKTIVDQQIKALKPSLF